MDKWNEFFKKLTSSPIMMWNGAAALIFIFLGLAILLFPSVMRGDNTMRFGFGGMIAIYGLFRLWTFYTGIKGRRDV